MRALSRLSSPFLLAALIAVIACSGPSSRDEKPLARHSDSLSSPVELKDFTPIPSTVAGSAPQALLAAGTSLFFTATDPSNGLEVFKAEENGQGAQLVQDLYPGFVGSNPSSFALMGGSLYFIAAQSSLGCELFKTDGTPGGTELVKRFLTGCPRNLTSVGASLFFAANDGTNGEELWKSDGTAQGTSLVKDLYVGTSGSAPARLTNVNGRLFFTANDAAGIELWTSDGTAQGTTVVKAGSSAFIPFSELTAVGSTLFFSFEDSATGPELWKSDGTPTGTVMVKEIQSGNTGSFPDFLVASGSTLYFRAYEMNSGRELWKSDGTAAGTVLVKDANPGSADGCQGKLVVSGSSVFFSGNDGTTGFEPWISDGTATGTRLLKNLNPGFNNSIDVLTSRGVALGGVVYFPATDGVNGEELWRTDGTTAGTVLVKELRPGSSGAAIKELTVVGSHLFFQADDGVHFAELWKSDGTASGTTLVEDIQPQVDTNSLRSSWRSASTGTRIVFVGAEPFTGFEPWSSDGTVSDTQLIELTPDAGGSYPNNFTRLGSEVYFTTSNTAAQGSELWRSDGTRAGTSVIDLAPGTASSNPSDVVAVGSKLFFTASPTGPMGLYVSDGTLGNTVKLKDGLPSRVVGVGSTAFFVFYDSVSGYELWKSDGTVSGTVLVKDIVAGTGSSNPMLLTAVGNQLFFAAKDATTGYELWKSDGTAAGTTRVLDLRPGAQDAFDSLLSPMVGAGGKLFFVANDGTYGLELWVSDGTAAGTTRLTDVRPGNLTASIRSLAAVGSEVYFVPLDPVNGAELWKSDGTVAGTGLVKDLWPGPLSGMRVGAPMFPIESEGVLVFPASNGVTGEELWRTDGTANGTVQVADVNPGVGSSNPRGLAMFGSYLGFGAEKGDGRVNPWAIPLVEVLPDRVPPTVTCPGAVTAEATSAAGATVTYGNASASDDRTASPTLSYSVASGEVFALGTTSVTVTAADEAGNEGTCSFEVTVSDTVAPSVTCPSDLSVTSGDAAGAAVVFADASATDAVTAQPTVSYSKASGEVFPVGSTVVTVSASDDAGNSASCTFNVEVTYVEPDAGVSEDAGVPDAGGEQDAGVVDAGTPDAGSVDAGEQGADAGIDAGTVDPGTGGGAGGGGGATSEPEPTSKAGCGCGSTGGASIVLWALGAFVIRRRRIG